MFGNLFGGLFSSKKPEIQNDPDALGQASMGSPEAFGQGVEQPDNRLAMMLLMGKRGFNMGMNGFKATPQSQFKNVYQPMTPTQQGGWFNPNGGR